MATKEKRKQIRQELRDKGFRQLEVWLPYNVVDEIDELKVSTGAVTRNEVVLRLIEGGLGKGRLPATGAKLAANTQ